MSESGVVAEQITGVENRNLESGQLVRVQELSERVKCWLSV